MTLSDIVVLALLLIIPTVVWLIKRRNKGCCGDCSGCSGCHHEKKCGSPRNM
ncbi:MAG: hypothetical protein ACI4Q4_06395 [Oscillospiraceae bacterium]